MTPLVFSSIAFALALFNCVYLLARNRALHRDVARLALENAYLKADLVDLRATLRRQSRRAGIIDRARG